MRGGMQDVELVEERADPADRPTIRDPHPLASAGRAVVAFVVRRRWWVAAVATVAAVGVAVPPALAARAERAAIAALADVPGVALPVDADLGPLWSTEPVRDPASMLDDRQWLRDDVLVTWTSAWDSGADQQLRGFDAADGTIRWERTVTSLPPGVADGTVSASDPTTCVAPRRAVGDGVVACLTVAEWAPVTDTTSNVDPASLRLVVVDAATGAVLHEQDEPTSAQLTAVEGDLLVARTTGAGTATLVRLDPLDGRVRWRMDADPTADAPAGRAQAWAQVLDGTIVFSYLGTTRVLTPAGAPVHPPVPGDWAVLAGGRVLALTYTGPGSGFVAHDEDGRPLATIHDSSVLPSVDDGSVPDLMLAARSEEVAAVDLRDGSTRWTVPRGPANASVEEAVVVRGRVLLVDPDTIRAVDGATGTLLWSTPTRTMLDRTVVVDGRHVLTLEALEGEHVVVARDLADGATRWEAPVPDAVQRLGVVDGRLFGVTATTVIALGSPGR